MTVNKLIEELLRLPPETEVYVIYPPNHEEVPLTAIEKSFKHEGGVLLDWYNQPERNFAKK